VFLDERATSGLTASGVEVEASEGLSGDAPA
jgi:hypothetical protein